MAWFRRKKKDDEDTLPPVVEPVTWAPGGAQSYPPQPQYAQPQPMPSPPVPAPPPAPYPPVPAPYPPVPAASAVPMPPTVQQAPPPLADAAPTAAVPLPPPVEEPWPPPRRPRIDPPLPPGVPDIKFERFRHGVPHVEISTNEGETLVITPAHPLFEEFVRWGSEWSAAASEPRVFRVHPENMRLRGVKRPPRGRVRRTS